MAHRRRTALLAATGLAGVAATALELLPQASTGPRSAAWVLVWLATSALVVTRARRARTDRRLWRAVALFVVVVGAALAAHPLLVAELPGSAVPLLPVSVAVLATALAVYSAFVRWNLTRTHSGDPGDVLNAVSAVLTGQALMGLATARLVPSAADLPWWQLQPMLAAAAAALVLTGTVLSTAMTAGGGRDRTAWLFVAGCTAALVGGASLAVGTERGAEVTGAGAWLAVAAACVALAAVLRRAVAVPLVVDGVSATVGAYAVLLLALAVLVADGLLPGTGAADGAEAWVLVAGALGAAGAATRLLLNLSELTQLAASRQEAETDPLTGVANRRGVLRRVEQLQRAGLPFAVALLDLDRFKQVNDDFGHAAGDALLVQVAERLAGVDAPAGSTSHALAGRLGGDEFAVVVPLPAEGAAAAAGQWREALLEALAPAHDLGGCVVRVGSSTGIAVHLPEEHRGSVGPADLLRRADAAMYATKRAGGGARLDGEGPAQPELDEAFVLVRPLGLEPRTR